MGGVENKEGNVPSNGTDEVKVREDTFYDDCHTGNNKSSNDGTNAKDIGGKEFSNDKRSVSPNIYFATKSTKTRHSCSPHK